MTTIDYDRELLSAALTRHLAAMPVRASTAISAAVDELIDPLVPPAVLDIDQDQTRVLTSVLTAVQRRLQESAQNAATVRETMACARAARELGGALQVLDDQQGRR